MMIKAFIHQVGDECEPNELGQAAAILSQDFIAFFGLRHCKVVQCRRDERTSLADEVGVQLVCFLEVVEERLPLHQVSEKVLYLVARIVLVINFFELVDVVNQVCSIVCRLLLLVPIAVVEHLHEINQALVENVELICGQECEDGVPQAWPHSNQLFVKIEPFVLQIFQLSHQLFLVQKVDIQVLKSSAEVMDPGPRIDFLD